MDNPDSVLGCVHATMHDGVLEVIQNGGRSYGVVRHGQIVRGCFCDDACGPPEADIRRLPGANDRWVRTRLWPVPSALPAQAAPALIQAYRELIRAAVKRLGAFGIAAAGAVAEPARRHLMPQQPALERLSLGAKTSSGGASATTTMGFRRTATSTMRDSIVEKRVLSAAIGVWLRELLWNAPPADGTPPARFFDGLLRERRHMFPMAVLFDALSWKLVV